MKIVIIGAGVAGLSIGWRLQQLGVHVTVLDRAQPASAATWASAGMIAAGGELGGAETPEAEFARVSSGLWPDFAKQIEEASGQPVHYRRCGALIVGTEAEYAAARAWPGAERIDRAQALAMEPMLAPEIAGAIWAPDEAQVDSRALGRSLALAFIRAGGTLVPNEVVLRFKVEGNKAVSIVTPFGRHEADAFVIAAGAWSGTIEGLASKVVPHIKPIKGQMLSVAPRNGARLPSHIVWGSGGYLVPRADRLLIGATSEDAGFDTSLSDAGADFLSKSARSLMPEIAHWDVTERWAGLRPMSPDGLPLLGRSALSGLFVATGQYRNGILFAPAIARHMSRVILEGDAEIAAFDPRRFSMRDE